MESRQRCLCTSLPRCCCANLGCKVRCHQSQVTLMGFNSVRTSDAPDPSRNAGEKGEVRCHGYESARPWALKIIWITTNNFIPHPSRTTTGFPQQKTAFIFVRVGLPFPLRALVCFFCNPFIVQFSRLRHTTLTRQHVQHTPHHTQNTTHNTTPHALGTYTSCFPTVSR